MTQYEIKCIEKFNSSELNFGVVDMNILTDVSSNYKKVFFFFPMIERLIRLILHDKDVCDIENYGNSTFKTMNSILQNNREIMINTFGIYITSFVEELYKEEGIRNQFMHYCGTFQYNPIMIHRIQNMFIELIVYYVEYNLENV